MCKCGCVGRGVVEVSRQGFFFFCLFIIIIIFLYFILFYFLFIYLFIFYFVWGCVCVCGEVRGVVSCPDTIASKQMK